MAEQKKNTSPRTPTQREEGGVGTSQLPKKGERIREELDKLLDESSTIFSRKTPRSSWRAMCSAAGSRGPRAQEWLG